MKNIRTIIQYGITMMMRLGVVPFSLLLIAILTGAVLLILALFTPLFQMTFSDSDTFNLLRFALFITPFLMAFLAILIRQLQDSRKKLSNMVQILEDLHVRDTVLHDKLQYNVNQLQQEADDRAKAEQQRQQIMAQLQAEVASHHQAKIELEKQTNLLRSFIDTSPDLVFYHNNDFEFSSCNRAMELLTGKSESQLIGLKPNYVYPANIAKKDIETDEKVFQHHVSITYELWMDYPDGHRACFEIRKVPFYDKLGNCQGLIGFGRDITEHKRYQEALEKASRDKTTFISTISHELRTPLNGIVGLSRILLDMPLLDEQKNYLQTIYVSAVALGNIFNDIIELDKIERHKIQLQKQPINLIDFLTSLEMIAGLLTTPKKLTFSLNCDENVPEQIIADDTRLRQILWNVIGNAVKFTTKGGISVNVWYQQGQLFFAIQDSGIGIAKNEQQKIFTMYYQVKQPNDTIAGTGIGLPVSQRLAKAMGGDINVQSEFGIGSCFTISIEAPPIDELTSSTTCDDDLPLLHILLVEDIELNVVVARSMLEKLGHTVEVAMSGEQALTMFDPKEYDLILLDIHLPDMTGFDVAKQIHEHYGLENLPPIIALTAHTLKNQQEYLTSGMDGVLNKPLLINDLVTLIKQFWGDSTNSASSNSINKIAEYKQSSHEYQQYETILDLEILQQYMELIGPDILINSITMFKKLMPDYLQLLVENILANNQQEIVNQAHKIKGATGSIGLKRLQKLAELIQTPSIANWQEQIPDWLDDLKQYWHQDIRLLYQWIEQVNIPKKG